MRSKSVSNMKPISIRAFLKAVENKRFRVQLHYYKEDEKKKCFSVANIVIDRVERNCDRLTLFFGGNWLLIQLTNKYAFEFYNGDMLYYCIEADGVEVFANMI